MGSFPNISITNFPGFDPVRLGLGQKEFATFAGDAALDENSSPILATEAALDPDSFLVLALEPRSTARTAVQRAEGN